VFPTLWRPGTKMCHEAGRRQGDARAMLGSGGGAGGGSRWRRGVAFLGGVGG
jgi:hypothetical protein